MKHIDFWCLDCPTRVRITTDKRESELEFETRCPACANGYLWDVKTLMKDGYTRGDGEKFVLRKHTENEVEALHEELNRFEVDGELSAAEDEYRRAVETARQKLEEIKKKGPRR